MSFQAQYEPCAAQDFDCPAPSPEPVPVLALDAANHKTPEYRPEKQEQDAREESNSQPPKDSSEDPAIEPEPSRLGAFGPVNYGMGVSDMLEGCEGPWDYFPGSHHPVHLGDRLGPLNQYKVINKLGNGGFANTWLCRVLGDEPTRYVALKIVQGRLSGLQNKEVDNVRRLHKLAETDPDIKKYCLLPYKFFEHDGPNGFHDCLVYPVAGPPLGDIDATVSEPHDYLRNLARQAADAMAVLHRNCICHGDFRPSNLLRRVEGLDGLTEQEVEQILGEPEGMHVLKFEDADPEANPPRYILRPVLWMSTRLLTDQLCVIDYGESFHINLDHKPDRNGIPFDYASPELVLQNDFGLASDIWALAATMFEIRLGSRFFYTQESSLAGYLAAMIHQLGKLPEPLWSQPAIAIEKREGEPPLDCADLTVLSLLEIENFDPENDDHPFYEDGDSVRRRTLQQRMAEEIGHLLKLSSSWGYGWHKPLVEEERELFEDLIFTMTSLDPAMRPNILQVLDHPWFECNPREAELPLYEGGKRSGYGQEVLQVEYPVHGNKRAGSIAEEQSDAIVIVPSPSNDPENARHEPEREPEAAGIEAPSAPEAPTPSGSFRPDTQTQTEPEVVTPNSPENAFPPTADTFLPAEVESDQSQPELEPAIAEVPPSSAPSTQSFISIDVQAPSSPVSDREAFRSIDTDMPDSPEEETPSFESTSTPAGSNSPRSVELKETIPASWSQISTQSQTPSQPKQAEVLQEFPAFEDAEVGKTDCDVFARVTAWFQSVTRALGF